MKKTIQTGLLLLPIMFFISCQEDEVITDLVKIEENLKNYVAEHNVSTCSIWFVEGDRYFVGYDRVKFEIEDGFLKVDEAPYVSYNLLYLLQYYKNDDGNLEITFRR